MAKQTFTTGQVLTAAQVTALQTNQYNQTVTTQTTSYVLVAADVGTRVYMNAAGATTITVNTGLFAAGDTVWLGNIGAGSCVVTAGTATVSKFSTASLTLSQYQGAYLYFVSTGVAILYSDSAGASTPLTTKGDLFGYDTANARVPIGTNNQVLTADSTASLGLKWATPTIGGFTLISTTTPTVSTSVVTLSSIPATYKHLLVTAQSLDSTGTTQNNITIQFNGDTTTAYDSNLTGVNQSNATVLTVVGGSTGGMGGFSYVYNYTTSSVTKFFNSLSYSSSLDGSTAGGRTNFGTYRSTSAISSITLTLGGGETYLATGSVFLYGLS